MLSEKGKKDGIIQRIQTLFDGFPEKGVIAVFNDIEIGVVNDEDTYLYTIEVFDNGNSSIDVHARQRERISYSGEIYWGKKQL